MRTWRSCTSTSAFDRTRLAENRIINRRRDFRARRLSNGKGESMTAIKRTLVGLAVAAALGAGAARAQISDNVIKIGVLSDMSSLYTDLAGAGSVVAAKMAVEDSGIEKRGYKVEIGSADTQN